MCTFILVYLYTSPEHPSEWDNTNILHPVLLWVDLEIDTNVGNTEAHKGESMVIHRQDEKGV